MTAVSAARKVIARMGAALDADLSVRLWDGSVQPLIPGARDDLLIVIAGPDVLKRFLLKPGAETAFRLIAEGRLRVEGGSPLEALDRIDHGRLVHLRRSLNVNALLADAWPLLFVPSRPGESAPSADPAAGRGRDRDGRADADFIRFHYDVGNDFYALFLDPEHVYSSAAFAPEADELDAAQIRKLDRICRKLNLKPGDRLLDVGCGWGALAIHAATRFGAFVHGVTLSPAQLAFAQGRVAALGLTDRITLELKDYRDLAEQYDAVSQIEMFEHLGFRNHDLHFKTVHRLLKSGGLYLHQASIRRGGVRPGRPGRPARAITRFIFPGGELDTLAMTVDGLARHRFEVLDVETLRPSFERTLREWSRRLHANRAEAERLIGAPRVQLWLAYFALFARGFERGVVSVHQTLARRHRPGRHGPIFR
ncbi:MAG TPA: cyclopropane-fatty-acyl-phospholipid synthase family protein [Brevundimonas sp.]|jgi:cyclopropane-fatty-acyl-phospholipid synthase|uniref:cyclopropane-fatty-acyl-phospholipid synthase family protein n=1 Tax=Brevundimonas sp. TaxID=1871086 RepID=UPI002DE6EFCE|nr:cyclopropane-fatty-acyl-phospholipid synthase family protein [Brevundimonas sp.]